MLLASDKGSRAPSVSLVLSPEHTPGPHGVTLNFHLGDHAALAAAVQAVEQHDGTVSAPLVEADDGQRYLTVRGAHARHHPIAALSEKGT